MWLNVLFQLNLPCSSRGSVFLVCAVQQLGDHWIRMIAYAMNFDLEILVHRFVYQGVSIMVFNISHWNRFFFFFNLLSTIYQITMFSTDYSDLYMSRKWIPLLVHRIVISWLCSIYRAVGGSGAFLGFSCPSQVSRRFAVRLLRCL